MSGFGCLVLFLAPFMGVSLVTAVLSVRALLAGDWKDAGILAFAAITFGLISGGLLTGALRARPRVARAEALRRAHPDAPWLWRDDWAAGRSVSETGTSAVTRLVFAAVWNLLCAPILFVVPREVDKGNTLALIALLMPAAGVGLIVWAGRELVRWKKFGSTVFVLAAVPAPPGGRLEGVIETALPRDVTEVIVRLACIRRTTARSGDRDTSEHLLWQDEQAAPGPFELRPASRVAIPVRFDVPADALPTQTVSAHEEIVWRLEATAEVPGVDYAARFDVPVFGGTAVAAAPSPPSPVFAPAAAPSRPSRPSIEVAPTASGGTAFWFGAARNAGAATSFTVFLAIFCGSVWVQAVLGVPIIFQIVTGAVCALILLIVVHLWTGTTRVLFERGTVTISKTLLGVPWTRRVSCAEITDVTLAIGMSTGSRAWYDVRMVRRAGPVLSAGGGVANKREAEWIAAEMKRLLREAGGGRGP